MSFVDPASDWYSSSVPLIIYESSYNIMSFVVFSYIIHLHQGYFISTGAGIFVFGAGETTVKGMGKQRTSVRKELNISTKDDNKTRPCELSMANIVHASLFVITSWKKQYDSSTGRLQITPHFWRLALCWHWPSWSFNYTDSDVHIALQPVKLRLHVTPWTHG